MDNNTITDNDLLSSEMVSIAKRGRYHAGDTLIVRPSTALPDLLEIINIYTGRSLLITADALEQFLMAKARAGYDIMREPPICDVD